MQHDGRVLETPEENLALLRSRAQAFAARKLATCISLEVTLEAPAAASSPAQSAA